MMNGIFVLSIGLSVLLMVVGTLIAIWGDYGFGLRLNATGFFVHTGVHSTLWAL